MEILVVKLYAIELFTLFFGERWGISGEISKTLVWSYTLNFISISFSTIFISLRKIKRLSILQFIYFGAILFLIHFRDYQFAEFIHIYVYIEVCYFVLYLSFLLYIVMSYEKEIRSSNSQSGSNSAGT